MDERQIGDKLQRGAGSGAALSHTGQGRFTRGRLDCLSVPISGGSPRAAVQGVGCGDPFWYADVRSWVHHLPVGSALWPGGRLGIAGPPWARTNAQVAEVLRRSQPACCSKLGYGSRRGLRAQLCLWRRARL